MPEIETNISVRHALGAEGSEGFSLIEIMVASALMGVAAMAIAQMAKNTHERQIEFKNTANYPVEVAQVQSLIARLNGTSQNAFLHLPIKSNCPGAHSDEPCLRQVVAGNRYNNVQGLAGVPVWTEFYRDHDAAWPGTLPVPMQEDATSVEQRSSTFDFPAATLRADYYATWRLTSPASPPFLMLSAAKTTSHQFVFDYDFDGTNHGPDIQANANSAGRFVYFSATDDAGSFTSYEAARVELQSWKASANGLMVVYNQDFPDQYTIQRVNDITWDNGATRIGFELVPVATGTPFVDAGTFSFGYYAKANDAALAYDTTATGVIWGGAGTFWGTRQGHSAAWSPAEDFYPFPSEYFSISRTGAAFHNPDPEPFAFNAGAVDIRRIAFYYNNLPTFATRHGHRPKIIGIPVVATTFYLAPGITPPGCDTHYGFADFRQGPGCPATNSVFYSLRMRTLPGNQEIILIPRLKDSFPSPRVVATDDPEQGFVTFIRQLGSQLVTAVIK